MSLSIQAKELLKKYDIQTPVGAFANNVLEFLDNSVFDNKYILTKISKNDGVTKPYKGYIGSFIDLPFVGKRFIFTYAYGTRQIITSEIKEVTSLGDQNYLIMTNNSIYSLSPI